MTESRSQATPDDFAARLASAAPTPGGGAAAARVGVYAASLCSMVCTITLQRAGETASSDELGSIRRHAEELAREFGRLEQADMEAFENYLAALRLPRSTSEEKKQRDSARAWAARVATEVPLKNLEASLRLLDLVEELIALASAVRLRAESDIGVALELGRAAFRSAELNVLVNLPALGEDDRRELEARYRPLVAELDRRYAPLRDEILSWLRNEKK